MPGFFLSDGSVRTGAAGCARSFPPVIEKDMKTAHALRHTQAGSFFKKTVQGFQRQVVSYIMNSGPLCGRRGDRAMIKKLQEMMIP